MTPPAKNAFLSVVMQQLRRQRPPVSQAQHWFNRVEQVPAGNYVELWFLTQGCSWDRQGACTMCNYGCGATRSVAELVDSVRIGLAEIDVSVDELMVAPSGGMLDPREVPPEARRRIYALVQGFPTETFLIETRPETVTDRALAELVATVPGKRLGVEMGLESSCPWVERFCVNRGHTPKQFARAVETCGHYDVTTYGNVSLGTAFLSPAEAVEDAVRTVRWVLDLGGATRAVVFPTHIKPYTLLDHLHALGTHEPPSLWSLVEVLKQCADQADRVEIAWYKSYYDDEAKIRRSPRTCARCQPEVLTLLDRYRAEQSLAAIGGLDAVDCACRELWKQQIERSSKAPLPERVLDAYEFLVEDLGLETWWEKHGARTRADLKATTPMLTTPGVNSSPYAT